MIFYPFSVDSVKIMLKMHQIPSQTPIAAIWGLLLRGGGGREGKRGRRGKGGEDGRDEMEREGR